MAGVTTKLEELPEPRVVNSSPRCLSQRSAHTAMDSSINVACGFLGGTILSTEGGYRVLQHPRPERVFKRIADARWFLAVNFCDGCPLPAGILNHEGTLSFQNEAALTLGETAFLPLEHRKAIFTACLTLSPGESTTYSLSGSEPSKHALQIWGLEVDPRYGRVAIVRSLDATTSNTGA